MATAAGSGGTFTLDTRGDRNPDPITIDDIDAAEIVRAHSRRR